MTIFNTPASVALPLKVQNSTVHPLAAVMSS